MSNSCLSTWLTLINKPSVERQQALRMVLPQVRLTLALEFQPDNDGMDERGHQRCQDFITRGNDVSVP